MFLQEYAKYARNGSDAVQQPASLLVFVTKVEGMTVPSYIQAQPANPIQVFLEIDSKSKQTNALKACSQSFALRPRELAVNSGFLVTLSQDDEVWLSIHAQAGAISGRLARFVLSAGAAACDMQQFLAGQARLMRLEDVDHSAVMSVALAAHNLSYLQENVFYALNEPPRMFVAQGFYQFQVQEQIHYLNATMLNRPVLHPGYVLRLDDLGGLIVERLTRQRVGLQQLRAAVRERLIERLVPAVEARNDVLIDRNAVTLNLDKISLLVTSHTGVFPLAQKYLQISASRPESSSYADKSCDFYLTKAEDFKFSAAAFLVLQLVVQAQIFVSSASSEQIDEPFPQAMNYSICCGAWSRGMPLTGVELDCATHFGGIPALDLHRISANLQFICQEIGFRDADQTGLIDQNVQPPNGYFRTDNEETRFLCGEIGEIGDIAGNGEDIRAEERNQGSIEAFEATSQLADSQLLQKYPVNVKLRVYGLQPMIEGYFSRGRQIAVRMHGKSSLGEVQSVDSQAADIDFTALMTLQFAGNFFGTVVEIVVQLLEYVGGVPAVIGEQVLYCAGETVEKKKKADGFQLERVARYFDFDKEFNGQDFFTLTLQENRLDSYFDCEPPEIAALQVQFAFVPRSAVDYEDAHDAKAISLQHQRYWQAMQKSDEQRANVAKFQAEVTSAFNTPERMYALATIRKNAVFRFYCIQNGQRLDLDIAHGVQLPRNSTFSLSLLYPSPLVLQAIGFSVELCGSEAQPAFQLDNAQLDALRVRFLLNYPGKPQFRSVRVVFAIYQQNADLGRIHCVFQIASPQPALLGCLRVSLPYMRRRDLTLVFRRRKDNLALVSPNCSGCFLDKLDVPGQRISKAKLRLTALAPVSVLQCPEFSAAPLSKVEAGAELTQFDIQNDEFITAHFSDEFVAKCGKGLTRLLLSDNSAAFALLLDFLPYCEVACQAGSQIVLPTFKNAQIASYPPQVDKKVQCLAPGEQHVAVFGDQLNFVCVLHAGEPAKVVHRYFLKAHGSETKQVLYQQPGKNVRALSAFPSLLRVKQCRITDDGWAIIVEIGRASSGHRCVCPLHVENQAQADAGTAGVILVEVVWE